MKINKEIEKWENQTIKITNQFLYDYFDDNDPYYFYVADEIGGILNYGDYFFNFSDILTCYKIGITEEQLLNWYDFCLSNHSVNISLAKYILSPQERKEAEEKHLEELKDRVKLAEKEFKKALEKYERKD
jgi:hypothetical protein